MEKQKKSYGKTALIVLLLIVTIASLVLATYAWAKYSSVFESFATAQVAKWNVDVEFTSKDFEETFQHVVAQRLAPGTKGKFDITVNSQDTEVDFDYEIIFEGATAEYADESDKNNKETLGEAQVPKHLHFYTNKDSHDTDHEINVNSPTQNGTAATDLKGTLTRKDTNYAEDETSKTTETKTIYWEWPYENPEEGSRTVNDTTDQQYIKTDDQGKSTLENGKNGITDYDDQDTLDGMHPVTVTVKFKVVATQKDPSKK